MNSNQIAILSASLFLLVGGWLDHRDDAQAERERAMRETARALCQPIHRGEIAAQAMSEHGTIECAISGKVRGQRAYIARMEFTQ